MAALAVVSVAVGSCATGAREPSQGRKAAALSGTCGVPQIAWPPPDDRLPLTPVGTDREQRSSPARRTRSRRQPQKSASDGSGRIAPWPTSRSTGATGRGASARSAARSTSSRALRNAVRDETGSATPTCSAGPGARARPRPPASWPRPSTARTSRTASRAASATSCVAIEAGTSLRRPRARRRLEQRRRRHPRPDRPGRARLARAARRCTSSTRSTCSSPARVERAAEDARGAARPRACSCWPPPTRRRCCPPSAAAPSTSSSTCSRPTSSSEHVRWIVGDAGLDVSDEAIDYVVRQGRGSARDTLSALDQVVAAGGVVDRAEPVERARRGARRPGHRPGPRRRRRRAVAGARPPRARRGAPRPPARRLPRLPRRRAAPPGSEPTRSVTGPGRSSSAPRPSTRAMEALGAALVEMRQAADPRIPLEVALVRLTADGRRVARRPGRAHRAARSGDRERCARRSTRRCCTRQGGGPRLTSACSRRASPRGARRAAGPRGRRPRRLRRRRWQRLRRSGPGGGSRCAREAACLGRRCRCRVGGCPVCGSGGAHPAVRTCAGGPRSTVGSRPRRYAAARAGCTRPTLASDRSRAARGTRAAAARVRASSCSADRHAADRAGTCGVGNRRAGHGRRSRRRAGTRVGGTRPRDRQRGVPRPGAAAPEGCRQGVLRRRPGGHRRGRRHRRLRPGTRRAHRSRPARRSAMSKRCSRATSVGRSRSDWSRTATPPTSAPVDRRRCSADREEVPPSRRGRCRGARHRSMNRTTRTTRT